MGRGRSLKASRHTVFTVSHLFVGKANLMHSLRYGNSQVTTYNWSRMPTPKKTHAVKRSRRAAGTTELKTEAIERLEKLATDLAGVTAEASAVAEIVREGLAAEETNHSGAGAAKPSRRKHGAG